MTTPTVTEGDRRWSPLPRDLHPGAWWLWALGLAAAATFTLNPIICLMVVAVACLVVAARRTEAPWALSFRFYLYFALLVVVLRIIYRILLGGSATTDDVVLLNLPQIPLPEVARGIDLLGPFTLTEFTSALYDGIRLGTMIVCVGAANTLANPRELLKSVPPALYEVGTAIVVALSVFPQLAESVQRVHRARRLRGEPGRGVGFMRRLVVPVLEDALERSMTLAAGMDARGYGRSGTATPRQRATTGLLMLLALFGLSVGTYAILDRTAPRILAAPMALGGVVFALAALWSAGRRVQRTRYRPSSWRFGEVAAAASGLAVAVGMRWVAAAHPEVAYSAFDAWPTITLSAIAVVLVGALPAFLTPVPVPEFVEPESTDGEDDLAAVAERDASRLRAGVS